ncbi:MAG TPA: PP2C family serine/threonine-protein phosphatase [Roseiflexaceae bacterium]|nr:PP2C family serine/threonine-protein phosphatase [Roseiflexaceae bacterium]
MKLQCSAQTDVGLVRDHNEDSYGVGEGPQVEQLGQLVIICDGMGGHAAGEVASRIGVDTVLAQYYADTDADRPAAVRRAVERANAEIYRKGRGTMGTTAVAALLHSDSLLVANVGDSRAYLIRGESIQQISRDHSLVNDQIDAGVLTPEQARVSTIRNIITRALGHQATVLVDLFRYRLMADDMVLLSSDGLHGLVSDSELRDLARAHPPEEAVVKMVALANTRGGHDNITAVLARVVELDRDTTPLESPPEDGPLPPPRPDPLHERATDRLERPTTPLSPAELAAQPAPAAAPQAQALPPAPERRLSMLGGLLAAALLAGLALVIVLVLRTPPADSGTPSLSPAPAATAVASPTAEADPTSAATAAATDAPQLTSAPAATATAAPTSAPTAAATAAPTDTAPTAAP